MAIMIRPLLSTPVVLSCPKLVISLNSNPCLGNRHDFVPFYSKCQAPDFIVYSFIPSSGRKPWSPKHVKAVGPTQNGGQNLGVTQSVNVPFLTQSVMNKNKGHGCRQQHQIAFFFLTNLCSTLSMSCIYFLRFYHKPHRCEDRTEVARSLKDISVDVFSSFCNKAPSFP